MSIPDEIIVIKGILRFSWRQSKWVQENTHIDWNISRDQWMRYLDKRRGLPHYKRIYMAIRAIYHRRINQFMRWLW